MAITKKRSVPKVKEEILLSENEIKEVFDFYNFSMAQSNMNILTPDLLSGRMKDISMNPMVATETSLNAALIDPKNSENALMAFSENLDRKSTRLNSSH